MGKLRDLLDEAKRQRQANEDQGGVNPWGLLGKAASEIASVPGRFVDDLSYLYDVSKAGIKEIPYGWNYGVTMSPLGVVGDSAYLGTEMAPALVGQEPLLGKAPIDYPGTTEYEAKHTFGLDPPQTFLGNMAYMAGGIANPLPGGGANLAKIPGISLASLLLARNARGANPAAFDDAAEMIARGVSPGDVTRETYKTHGQGIEYDPVDKSYGFEISDVGPKGIKLKQKSMNQIRQEKPDRLGKLIQYDAYFENYPEDANLPVRIVPGEGGAFNRRFGYIEIGEREWQKNPVVTMKKILHEIGHKVDDSAGRAPGGNPDMPALDEIVKERVKKIEKDYLIETAGMVEKRSALRSAYGKDKGLWPEGAIEEEARLQRALDRAMDKRNSLKERVRYDAYKDLRGEQRQDVSTDRYGMTIEELIQWPRSEFETEAARKRSIVIPIDSDTTSKSIGTLSIRPRFGKGVKDIEILENPTADEVARFAGREMGTLRTIKDPKTGKVFVWNAEDALHYDVADALVQEGRASEKTLHMALNHKGGEPTRAVIDSLKKAEEAKGRLFSIPESKELTVDVFPFGVRGLTGYPRPMSILKNPSPEDVLRMGRAADDGDLRVLIDKETGDKYVWPASTAQHNDVKRGLFEGKHLAGSAKHSRFKHEDGSYTDLIDRGILPKQGHKKPKARDDDMYSLPEDETIELTAPGDWVRGDVSTGPKILKRGAPRKMSVLRNPSQRAIEDLVKRAKPDDYETWDSNGGPDGEGGWSVRQAKILRVIVDHKTGEKFVWDASDGIHQHIFDSLRKDGHIKGEMQDVGTDINAPYGRRFTSYYGTYEDLVKEGAFPEPTRQHKAPKPRSNDDMFSVDRDFDEYDLHFKPVWGGDATVRVMRNPSRDDVARLDPKRGDIRALVDRKTGDRYVWDAYEAFHDDVKSQLRDTGRITGDPYRDMMPDGDERFVHYEGPIANLEDVLKWERRQAKAPKPRDDMFSKPAPVLLGSQAKGLADTPEDFPRPQFPDLEEPRQLTRASVRNEGTRFAGAPAHVTSEAAEDATVDSYLARVLAGIPAMDWYLNVSRDLLKMSGNRLGVADHLAGSLGPTSANTALAPNAQTGMRGYYQGATGKPIKTATGLINSRIEELFQGMVQKYGPKINPYVHHLRGEWEPPPDRAVHDVWDRRAWGYSVDKAATEAEHRWMDLATAKAVKKANDTKLGGIDNWTPEKLQAAAWAVMKAEELGIPPGELAGGYLPEFDRLTGNFRIETNPGVKNPVSSLPEAGQDAYMRSVMNNLLTPEGQLAPLQQAGGIVPPNQTAYVGAGDWEGTHSKVISTPFIGSLLGGEYQKKPNGNVRVLREGGLVLAPEFRELADAVAATVGMLLGQKGVGYDLAREANRVMDVNAVRGITGGKQLTGDDIQKMNDYLKSKGHEGTFIVPEDSNRGFKIVFSGAEVNPGQRNLPKEETKSLLGQGQKILKEGKEAAEAAGMTVDEKLWVSSGNFVGDFDNYKPSKYMKSLQKGSKIRDRLNVKVQGAKGWAARQIQVMKSTGGQWDEVWMKTLETLRDGGFDAVDEAVKKKILPAAVVGILGYNLIEKEAKRDARSQDA